MGLREPVLVVDDDADIREFLTMSLEEEGYQVLTAENGARALDLVDQQRPGVILLDMRMPVMDGWAFSQAYRQLPGEHAPIIVITAATDAARFAQQINADGFLAKPFNLNEMLRLVGEHLYPTA
jgi:CheY-like chemotaxis protein